MFKTLLIFSLFLASNACSKSLEHQKTTRPNSVPQTFTINGIESTVEQRMKHYGVPGVSIVVIQSRKILWSQSYGVKNVNTNDKVEIDTLFQAASISKPVTAMVALKLSQEGKLQLDEAANKFLTSWKIPKNKYNKKSPVLVEQLINHTSGLSVHGFTGYNIADPIPSLIEVLNGALRIEQLLGSEKKANSSPIEVDNIPGKKFSYSGGGYTVLQQLLIDNEHSDFVALMKQNVLIPLNMSHSTYQQPLGGKLSERAATGHPIRNLPVDGNYHIYPEQAAAGLWTTSQDLAKFVIDIQYSLLDDSGVILSKNTAVKMTSPTINDGTGLGLFLHGANALDQGYFLHDGWNEGFSSNLIAHKANGYGVIILTNANQPKFNNEIIRAISKEYKWLNL